MPTEDRAKHCSKNEWTLVDSTKYLPPKQWRLCSEAFVCLLNNLHTRILHFREACQNNFHDNFSVMVHLSPNKLFLPIPFSLGWFK